MKKILFVVLCFAVMLAACGSNSNEKAEKIKNS